MIHNLISLSSIVGLFFVTDELLEMKDKGKKIKTEKKDENKNYEIGVDIYNEKTKLKEVN